MKVIKYTSELRNEVEHVIFVYRNLFNLTELERLAGLPEKSLHKAIRKKWKHLDIPRNTETITLRGYQPLTYEQILSLANTMYLNRIELQWIEWEYVNNNTCDTTQS